MPAVLSILTAGGLPGFNFNFSSTLICYEAGIKK